MFELSVKARVVGCDALARIDEVVNRDAHDAHVLDPDGLLRLYDVNVSQGVVHALGRAIGDDETALGTDCRPRCFSRPT